VNPQKPHQKALRQGRRSIAGQYYLLTLIIKNRIPVFNDFYVARCFIGMLRDLDLTRDRQCLAWVVMPDHVHLLLILGDNIALSHWVRLLKGRSARQLNDLLNRQGPLWQPGFHDHALRQEEDVRSVARYIVANPLRAGLVSAIGDYPHWDCVWL